MNKHRTIVFGIITFIGLFLFLRSDIVLAHEDGAEGDHSEPVLATSTEIQGADLGVSDNPSRWEFIKNRWAIIFSSKVNKLSYQNQRAKMLLMEAQVELKNGNTEAAVALIEKYNTEMKNVMVRANQLASEAQNDPKAKALIDQITEQKILEASMLDALSVKATGEFNKKVTDAKVKAIKDLSQVLAHEQLSPVKIEEKLTKISEKLEKKTLSAEEKYAKRLAIKEQLEEQTNDPDIEKALENHEEATLDEIAQKHKDNLGKIVSRIEGNIQKHLVVLEELLSRVPEEAKPAVQEAIERSQKRLAESLEKVKENQTKLEKKIDDAVGRAKKDREDAEEARKKALDGLEKKLKEHPKVEEKVKKDIEERKKSIEEMKKNIEEDLAAKKKKLEEEKKKLELEQEKQKQELEAQKKAKEEALEKQKKAAEQASEKTKATATPKPTDTPEPTKTETKEEVREPKIWEVKYKNGAFDTSSITISKGDKVTFKNDSENNVQINSNPHPAHTDFSGLNIGTLGKGQSKTVEFSQTGTYGYHNHLNSSETGSITVK